MTHPTALITNALEFAGPPSVAALLDAGFAVTVHDRSFTSQHAREAYAAAHPKVRVLAEQDADAIIDAACGDHGALNVLVSNDAWPAVHGPTEQANVQALRDTLDALVVFPFALMKAAMPVLRRTAGSRVVMITSNRTKLPVHGGAIPDAARAALNALVRSFSIELAADGVPVNAIAPNYLYSETYYPKAVFVDDPKGRDFVEQVVPAGRLARPEEMGELVRYLATNSGTFMTGAVIDFSGGWPVAPKRPD
jgi:3-oxoacyl-[acyl-carrier protein] reductase